MTMMKLPRSSRGEIESTSGLFFLSLRRESGRKGWGSSRRTESFYRILHRVHGQV